MCKESDPVKLLVWALALPWKTEQRQRLYLKLKLTKTSPKCS